MPRPPKTATPTADRLLLAPVDDNPRWLAITTALARLIGDDPMLAWFGHCRFDGVEDGRITLSHWCAFSAQESLARYGASLCRAAGVWRARVHNSGGHRPRTPKMDAATPRPPAPGFESYRLPPATPSADTMARVANAVASLQRPSAPVLKPDPTASAYADGAALARAARDKWAKAHGAEQPLPEPPARG